MSGLFSLLHLYSIPNYPSYPAVNKIRLSALQSRFTVRPPLADTACILEQKLLTAVHYRIPCNILIGLGAQNDPERGVVALAPFQLIKHSDIHIHLSYVLMSYLSCFKIYQYKAFQNVVVENKVDVVVLFFGVYPLLT